jgi:hypothetical protein
MPWLAEACEAITPQLAERNRSYHTAFVRDLKKLGSLSPSDGA